MSRIFKVSDVASLPVSGEMGVLYLVQIDSAREAYIWNGTAFVPVAPQNKEWIPYQTNGKAGSTWFHCDISEIFDVASEFMVRLRFFASNNTEGLIDIVFPNDKMDGVSANAHNYMAGYYYDASYNCSIMVRFNRTNKEIYPVSGWEQLSGSTTGFLTYEVLYR